ncbi:MAG TPA: hypothetical protein VJB35_04480 [Candidatus Nanoarchaeia archaeon]|nr:hypothetical protein [Candidatus Nanoarchaeia archaeon]
MKHKFPTFWVIVLIFSLVWFGNEMNWINLSLPILPVILIIIAIGAIFNNYR